MPPVLEVGDEGGLEVAVGGLGRLAAHRLELEITENLLLVNSEAIMAELQTLKAMGVANVMDDFGTGYSSLASLYDFPIDVFKIDRSFIASDLTSERGRALMAVTHAVLQLARNIGVYVIAEGVENEVQLAELRRLGCDYAQGHLFHAAMPEADVSRLLGEGTLGYSGIAPGR